MLKFELRALSVLSQCCATKLRSNVSYPLVIFPGPRGTWELTCVLGGGELLLCPFVFTCKTL